jgi:hypothetical protein
VTERLAYVIVAALAIGGIAYVNRSPEPVPEPVCPEPEPPMSAELLFECAEALVEVKTMCKAESVEAMKRANLIFKCEQDLCESNGWEPPPDWEEQKKAFLPPEEYAQ